MTEIESSSRPSVTKPQLHSADLDASLNKTVLRPTEVGRLSYETLKIATNDFRTKVGQGSYGSVYHGWLDGREVAVKLNNVQSDQGRREFLVEVLTSRRVAILVFPDIIMINCPKLS